MASDSFYKIKWPNVSLIMRKRKPCCWHPRNISVNGSKWHSSNQFPQAHSLILPWQLLEALAHLSVARSIICTEYMQANIDVLHLLNKKYFLPSKNYRKSKYIIITIVDQKNRIWNINYGTKLKLVEGICWCRMSSNRRQLSLWYLDYYLITIV